MVSGLDKAFQLPEEIHLNEIESKNIISVVKAKNISQYINEKNTEYIFIRDKISNELEFSKKFPNFFNQLNKYKSLLEKRYDYGRDMKYWEWAFLRNYNLFVQSKEKIFVPCKERITKKDRFRFSYSSNCQFPTQDVTAICKKKTTKE